jgi:hypothetical protein
MNVIRIQDVFFDDRATLAMGAAFDQACSSLQRFADADKVRELIANRIIEAAKNGERDPIRLHSQAIMGFSIDDMSGPTVSVARDVPLPVYSHLSMEEFIHLQNLARYRLMLSERTHEPQRPTILQLLATEEAKDDTHPNKCRP